MEKTDHDRVEHYLTFTRDVLRVGILILTAIVIVVMLTACGNANDIGDTQAQDNIQNVNVDVDVFVHNECYEVIPSSRHALTWVIPEYLELSSQELISCGRTRRLIACLPEGVPIMLIYDDCQFVIGFIEPDSLPEGMCE